MTNMEQSKDIVQEVFLKLWSKKLDLEEPGMKAYLYTSIKNKCLDQLKNKALKLRSEAQMDQIKEKQSDSFFLKEVAVLEIYDGLARAMEKLPPKSKEVVKLTLGGLT
ncbi:MAG: sigma-70 family RNA polymerase sigma factor, partial [Draconibacterium sp.]